MAIGARPDDLSRAIVRLTEAGALRHDGASVTIVDPIALRRASCQCYDALKAALETPLAIAVPAASTSEDPAAAGDTRDNVLPMRSLPVCTVCGLGRNAPHKVFDECLRAIDAELHAAIDRARGLVQRRATIARESLEKYEKFLERRHS
jgi:hypothetical protein